MPRIKYNPTDPEVVRQMFGPSAKVFLISPELRRAMSDGIAERTKAANREFDHAQARARASMCRIVII